MNKFFTKLDFTIEYFNWASLNGNLVQEYNYIPNLSYYEITDYAIVKSLLPASIIDIGPCLIKFVEITGKGVLPPHVDYGLNVGLNYYFNPSGSTTRFFDRKENAVPHTDDKEKTHILKYADLIFREKFIAQEGDIYLINVSEVHEVIHFKDTPRQFLQIQWENIDYNIVLNKLLNDSGRN